VEPDGREPGALSNPVLATVAALVAVDAITLGRAQAVIGDHFAAPGPGSDRSQLIGARAAQDAASPHPSPVPG